MCDQPAGACGWGGATDAAAAGAGLLPELLLSIAKEEAAQAAQQELLAQVAELGVPVEEHGWGCAYLDLNGAAHTPGPRRRDGRLAGAAAAHAAGRGDGAGAGVGQQQVHPRGQRPAIQCRDIKLVGKTEERRFLSPLPTRLLPLSALSVQELSWLGIHTLGQFTQLPVTAVVQRYGAIGRIAHLWARGLQSAPQCVRDQCVARGAALLHLRRPPRCWLRWLTSQSSSSPNSTVRANSSAACAAYCSP